MAIRPLPSAARLETILCQALVKYRFHGLILSLLGCILAAFALPSLRLDTDPRLYFSGDDPYYQQLNSLQNEYGRANTITFVITIKDGDLFTRENLVMLSAFTKDAEQLPFAEQVNSLSNYTYSWSKDDEVYVDQLVNDASNLDAQAIRHIREISQNDIAVAGRLYSEKGKATSISLLAYLPEENRTEATLDLAARANDLAAAYENDNPHIDILLTGDIINNATIHHTIFSDALRITPILSA